MIELRMLLDVPTTLFGLSAEWWGGLESKKGHEEVNIISIKWLLALFGKRGKSRGGMIIRFTGGRESDSLRACRRPTILTACRTPS
jgi:hypothetical protein